jgi:nascent polypeptide-associated complex subunit beta
LFTVQASIPSNTFVVTGNTEVKRLEELLPAILTQLGPESMDYLRAYAESMGALKPSAKGTGNMETVNEAEEEDDEVPDLVENFEEAANK